MACNYSKAYVCSACRLAHDVTQGDLLGSQICQQYQAMCSAVADAVVEVSSTGPAANQKQFAVRVL